MMAKRTLDPLTDEQKKLLDEISSDNDELARNGYNEYLDFYDIETRKAIDAEHAKCTLDNPFGMCAQCEADFQIGQRIGAEDCELGVRRNVGQALWVSLRPHMPRNPMGVINGYADGYNAALLSKLGRVN